MPTRVAILGLDPIQREWLDAISTLAASGDVEIVGVAHRALAAAKDVADLLHGAPTFDDLRLLIKTGAPQVILMDRPSNVTLDFLLACVAQEIAILSLGPPVDSLSEAQALAAALPPRTHLLYIWPRFADARVARHYAQADDFVKPIRFASASWMGVNHAMAKSLLPDNPSGSHTALPLGTELPDMPVRSLSVLAWDLLGTLIHMMDLPTLVYAAVRGTVGSGNSFSDISGAAALTLRFPDDAAASVTLSDRAPPGDAADPSPWNRRDLLLFGAGGSIKISAAAYEFRDTAGKLIDADTPAPANPLARSTALDTLREFLHHFALPTSPHRGWEHRLEDIAATMEALVVSHRTGQAESPEHFRDLRR